LNSEISNNNCTLSSLSPYFENFILYLNLINDWKNPQLEIHLYLVKTVAYILFLIQKNIDSRDNFSSYFADVVGFVSSVLHYLCKIVNSLIGMNTFGVKGQTVIYILHFVILSFFLMLFKSEEENCIAELLFNSSIFELILNLFAPLPYSKSFSLIFNKKSELILKSFSSLPPSFKEFSQCLGNSDVSLVGGSNNISDLVVLSSESFSSKQENITLNVISALKYCDFSIFQNFTVMINSVSKRISNFIKEGKTKKNLNECSDDVIVSSFAIYLPFVIYGFIKNVPGLSDSGVVASELYCALSDVLEIVIGVFDDTQISGNEQTRFNTLDFVAFICNIYKQFI
jgi:hypothetical protein